MDIPVYRLIDLARLLFFRALLLEAERRRDVSPSTSAHDTLQTARTHRRRAARRGRGVRPAGTPLSTHGFDSRQRAVDLRPMPDLCGQRARRRRLFAFDTNGELIEAPTPAGDAPFAKRAARSSRGVADFSRGAVPCAERPVPFSERSVPSAAEELDASMRAVPSSDLPAPSTAEDLDASMRAVPSSERPMPSAAWDVHAAVRDVLAPAEDVPSLERAARSSRRPMPSAKRSAPSLEEIVSSDLLDSPFSERGVHSAKRSAPSAVEDVHAAVRDRGDSSEARYAALAKRSAQTADRLLRRVSRHRAKGK